MLLKMSNLLLTTQRKARFTLNSSCFNADDRASCCSCLLRTGLHCASATWHHAAVSHCASSLWQPGLMALMALQRTMCNTDAHSPLLQMACNACLATRLQRADSRKEMQRQQMPVEGHCVEFGQPWPDVCFCLGPQVHCIRAPLLASKR